MSTVVWPSCLIINNLCTAFSITFEVLSSKYSLLLSTVPSYFYVIYLVVSDADGEFFNITPHVIKQCGIFIFHGASMGQ